jgi:transcription elongation factor Elf1
MTPFELEKAFTKLQCTSCGSSSLMMMMGSEEKVDGVFCRDCMEFEELTIEQIVERLEVIKK